MDLNRIIPNTNNQDWIANKNILFYKKYAKIPICYSLNNEIYIFINGKLHKEIIKLVKHLQSLNLEFYLTSPIYSNPKNKEIENDIVINEYLQTFIDEKYYDGFDKIGFDLVKNMVDWCSKVNCDYDTIKDCYEKFKIHVNKKWIDYYTNIHYYEVKREDIRNSYNSLYREIQISRIL